MRNSGQFAMAVLAAVWAVASLAAASPDGAPGHGASNKRAVVYVGNSGVRWQRDYGVRKGHCDRVDIGSPSEAPRELPLGMQPQPIENREAATLIGGKIDSLLAAPMQRELDTGDRACLAHALEIGKPGKRVIWDNVATGVHYEMVAEPAYDGVGGVCRHFKLRAAASTGKSKRQATACAKSAGLWQLSQL
ncbi:MAG TPA: hypothetical protein VMG11_07055 [Steroidobacteraceae bacterium]|nr:hypothetical protein [Steroidobacteraceae bacterium]